jgi:hypothetical protein
MKKNLVLAISVLLFASLACNASNIPSLPGSNATKQPDNLLYKDDFSDPSSGWSSLTDADGITDYDEGFYRIRVDTIGESKNGMDMWSHPGVDLQGDVRIEVDATKIGGPDENDMGVLCRYTKKNDAFNFYYFLITSDGYIGIAKMKESDSKLISGEKMTTSDAIKTTTTNHIRADCIGDKLTLYVNGTQVATATDSEYTGGDIGLIAGSFDTPGVDIHFDNFIVTKP